ncbi:PREDICTED: uncharacterized protein LOC106817221 [Priapulus caudatus]|uniref:Uncharacterized protein LOC106817221 n=1 Tax=Priapulus caudatus TaxID=37621 RepID=A0ABM1EYU9_PRICU|nr:PREDICTED: uncharacterized protein LOC106817221 [Priapulus caudatus]XP_014677371.1 PREDICTED: uncharacterized protein LOC106817221 [Priapulus caudatus]
MRVPHQQRQLRYSNYDPRPVEYRKLENRNDTFRNTCINYQASHAGSMPSMQLFPPANPCAMIYDHDYLKQDGIAKFFSEEKQTTITDAEVNTIEVETRGQSANKVWRQEREKRITASNFGTIVKSTERRTS